MKTLSSCQLLRATAEDTNRQCWVPWALHFILDDLGKLLSFHLHPSGTPKKHCQTCSNINFIALVLLFQRKFIKRLDTVEFE